jgi:hypothetical protein
MCCDFERQALVVAQREGLKSWSVDMGREIALDLF